MRNYSRTRVEPKSGALPSGTTILSEQAKAKYFHPELRTDELPDSYYAYGAIENYRKSLALDPGNRNAEEMLETLTQK